MHYHHDDHPVDYGQHHLAPHLCGGDELEAGRDLRVKLLGELLGHGAEHLHGAQGCNEGGQLTVGDQRTVYLTEEIAHYQDEDDGYHIGRRAGKTDGGQQARGGYQIHEYGAQSAEHGAHRQVDAAAYYNEAHAKSYDALIGVVAQNIQPGHAHLPEHAAEGAGVYPHDYALDKHHHHQGEYCGEQGVVGPFILKPAQSTSIVFKPCLFHFHTHSLSFCLPPVARYMI